MSAAGIPLIILTGGTAGTGKTSLSKKLCAELNIAHGGWPIKQESKMIGET